MPSPDANAEGSFPLWATNVHHIIWMVLPVSGMIKPNNQSQDRGVSTLPGPAFNFRVPCGRSGRRGGLDRNLQKKLEAVYVLPLRLSPRGSRMQDSGSPEAHTNR